MMDESMIDVKFLTKFKPPYWHDPFDDGLPFNDFNRELIPPGQNEDYPEGAVGIRMDDDFWACAALPWSYHTKSMEEIFRELWPDKLEKVEFKPDSGDPWWKKYFDGEL